MAYRRSVQVVLLTAILWTHADASSNSHTLQSSATQPNAISSHSQHNYNLYPSPNYHSTSYSPQSYQHPQQPSPNSHSEQPHYTYQPPYNSDIQPDQPHNQQMFPESSHDQPTTPHSSATTPPPTTTPPNPPPTSPPSTTTTTTTSPPTTTSTTSPPTTTPQTTTPQTTTPQTTTPQTTTPPTSPPTTTPPTPPTSASRRPYQPYVSLFRYTCPREFLRLGNGCYYFSKGMASWQEAHFQCRNRRSQLLALNTAWEDRLLRRYLNRHSMTRLNRWMGGIYDWEQNEWVWGSTGAVMTHKGFLTPHPPHSPRWKCVFMSPSLYYRWNYDSCTNEMHYVCETRFIRIERSRYHS